MERGIGCDRADRAGDSRRRWRRCCASGTWPRGSGSGWRWSRRPGWASDVATIARWSGRTPRTVRRWLAAFRDGGVAALAGAPIPGRPPKADAAYLAALEHGRGDAAARRWGCRSMSGPRRRLSAYLAAHDRRAHRAGLAAGAAAPAALRLRPAQTHPRPPARPGRSRRLRARPAGGGGKRWRPHPERYELHYEDETHLDTNPYLSRVWHRVGTAADACRRRAPTGG